MSKGTKGKDRKPGFPVGPIKVKPCQGDEQKKNKRMTKYPAVAQAIPEEECPHGLVNNIRQKRTYKQKPDINTVSQRSKP